MFTSSFRRLCSSEASWSSLCKSAITIYHQFLPWSALYVIHVLFDQRTCVWFLKMNKIMLNVTRKYEETNQSLPNLFVTPMGWNLEAKPLFPDHDLHKLTNTVRTANLIHAGKRRQWECPTWKNKIKNTNENCRAPALAKKRSTTLTQQFYWERSTG